MNNNTDYKQTKSYYFYLSLVMLLGIGAILAAVHYFSDKIYGSAIEELFIYIEFSPLTVIMAFILGPTISAIIALGIYVLYRDVLSKVELFRVPKNVISKIIALIIIIIFILMMALLTTPEQFAFLAALVSIVSIIWNMIERTSNSNDEKTNNHSTAKEPIKNRKDS